MAVSRLQTFGFLMNKKWTIKYKVQRAKVLTEIKYFRYKVKMKLGIKIIGYGRNDGVIFYKLLKKYNLPKFCMMVVAVDENLEVADLNHIHESGLRINKNDYLSIIVNPDAKQVKMIVGQNMRSIISNVDKTEIEKQMQQKMDAGEIFAAVERGMKNIKLHFT